MTPNRHRQITEQEWLEDFSDFVASPGVSVPESLSESILNTVRQSLNPSAGLVFFKLLGIHSVVGTLSLAICDQFGMSPFKTGISLSEYFMRFGHSTCMFLCGFIFLSLTLASVKALFHEEELRVLQKNIWIQIPLLAFLSIAIFVGFGDGVVFSVAAYWFVGAVMGGLISSYLGRNLAATQ